MHAPTQSNVSYESAYSEQTWTKPVIYVNGANTNRAAAKLTAQKVAEIVGSTVTLVWNNFCEPAQDQSSQAPLDLALRMIDPKESTGTPSLVRSLVDLVIKYDADRSFLHKNITILAHSHGAIIVSKALEAIAPKMGGTESPGFLALKDRCRIITCGGAITIKANRAGYVRNYIHKDDAVSRGANMTLNIVPEQVLLHNFFKNVRQAIGVQPDPEYPNAIQEADRKFTLVEQVIASSNELHHKAQMCLNELLTAQEAKTQLQNLRQNLLQLHASLGSVPLEKKYNITITANKSPSAASSSSSSAASSSSSSAASSGESHSIANYLQNKLVKNCLEQD